MTPHRHHQLYLATPPLLITKNTSMMLQLARRIAQKSVLILLVQLILYHIIGEGKNHGFLNELQRNGTNVTSTTSPWLKRVIKNPRAIGCWDRPWICRGDEDDDHPKAKRLCCRNRCVDVSSDVNNCGLCGIRCPFAWQCCRGMCVDTNNNPFHCGTCENRCPFFTFCSYGMCGYAQPLPPFPFPFPPHKPKRPRPFPFLPKPFPPRPRPFPKPPRPFPFPPKPWPFPPRREPFPKPFPPQSPHPRKPFPPREPLLPIPFPPLGPDPTPGTRLPTLA